MSMLLNLPETTGTGKPVFKSGCKVCVQPPKRLHYKKGVMMMGIVRLIYASKLAVGCGPNDVLKIVDVSEKNNRKLGVTGALCYDPRAFLQCLEGPRDHVNRLYNTIIRDERHTDVTLLYYADVEERAFGEWAMAYVRADEVTGQLILRFGATKRFDPYAFSAEQAVRFLNAVVEERRRFLESEKRKIEAVG